MRRSSVPRSTLAEKDVFDDEDAADGEYGAFKEDSDVASHTSYNEAVVLFQMKQYGKALTLLEGLYSQIEPIEENLAVRICFLLLDVCFTLQVRRYTNFGIALPRLPCWHQYRLAE